MTMYRISRDKRKYSPTPIVKVEVVNGKEKETQVLFAPTLESEGSFSERHKKTEAWLQEICDFLNNK